MTQSACAAGVASILRKSRATSVAESLYKEFGTPFVLVDPASGTSQAVPEDFPVPIDDQALGSLAASVAAQRQVVVTSPVNGFQWLALPVWHRERIALVAIGVIGRAPAGVRLEHGGQANEVGLPGRALADWPSQSLWKWASAVAEQLRLEDKLRTKTQQHERVERQLDSSLKMLHSLDRLAGRLRISERPDKFPKLALACLLESVPAQCVAWVSGSPTDPVLVFGETLLDSAQIRQLVQAMMAERSSSLGRSFVENRIQDTPWGPDYPNVSSMAIVSGDSEKARNWIVAINSVSNRSFCQSDVARMLPVSSLLNVYQKNMNLYVDLKELLFGVVRALTSAIDAKDQYTQGHSERVARMAVALGRQLKLGTDELSNLYLAGLLHDVGKIGVDDSVLKKPGKLTDEEYRHVMTHVEIGVSILRELKRLRHILPGIRYHHERYDGAGYPQGLQGESIPLIARILAVADSFDAVSSDRPYRPRRNSVEVEQIVRGGAGSQWDPTVVDAAFACWEELRAIQQRGIGESLLVAVGDALHQQYPNNENSERPLGHEVV